MCQYIRKMAMAPGPAPTGPSLPVIPAGSQPVIVQLRLLSDRKMLEYIVEGAPDYSSGGDLA